MTIKASTHVYTQVPSACTAAQDSELVRLKFRVGTCLGFGLALGLVIRVQGWFWEIFDHGCENSF